MGLTSSKDDSTTEGSTSSKHDSTTMDSTSSKHDSTTMDSTSSKHDSTTEGSTSSKHDSKPSSSRYCDPTPGVWYRHSGVEEIYWFPRPSYILYKQQTETEIKAEVGDHHITHMWIKGELPTLDDIGSHITHLGVYETSNPTQLERLNKLPNLSVLELYCCNFPSGVPKWITQLTSLKELRLLRCQLTELPEGLGSLHQLEKLDLCDNNFSQGIPPEIGEMSSLKDLDMSSCVLTHLPAEFCQLQELRSLSLQSNNFTELPSAIYKLSKLETLDMRGNEQLEVIEEEILQLTKLTDFNCGDCSYLESPPYDVCKLGLTAVKKYFQDGARLVWYRHSGEEEIDELPSYSFVQYKHQTEAEIKEEVGDHHITHMLIKGELPTLDDIGSHITHLGLHEITNPTQLERLTSLHQLEVLDLSDNNFSQGIPPKISEMSSLKDLDMSSCKLTHLPAELSSLHQLETLGLSYNNFSQGIPPEIGEMSSLKDLNMSLCTLTHLPAELSSLHQLEKLDLSGNHFSQGILPVVCKMSSLKELNFRRCRLTDLPAEFCQLQELRSLSLRGNHFTELPSAIYKLSKLETLDMWDNKQLKVIEKDILQLTRLTDFNCSYCSCLQFPPYAVCKLGLTAMKRHFQDGALLVWYRHSGEEEIDELPPHLFVQYKQQTVAEIKEEVGDHHITHMWIAGELPTLDDMGSHITHLGIYGIANPTQLKRLDELPNLSVLKLFECNFPSGLPKWITQLASLKELRLQKCKITELPEGFCQLQELRSLSLLGNHFTELPSAIYKLSKLETLDMRENMQLKVIEKDILQLTRLTDFNCSYCLCLKSPPYDVCKQGLTAVKQYFQDLSR